MRLAAVLVIATALVSVTALVSMTPSAAADPVPIDTVFTDMGLFGHWALDCGRPPTSANPHVRIATPQPGEVEEIHDHGPEFSANHYRILSAERIGEDRLQVTAIFQPGTDVSQLQTLAFQVGRGTRRTLFNQPDGAAVRVRDGIVVGSGRKTPLLRKCD